MIIVVFPLQLAKQNRHHRRAFLNDRANKKLISPIDMDGWSVLEMETDAVYCKEEEINRLLQFDLTYHPHLVNYRDEFVLGCMTGLRFSDFSLLHDHDLRGDLLYKKQKKSNHYMDRLFARSCQQYPRPMVITQLDDCTAKPVTGECAKKFELPVAKIQRYPLINYSVSYFLCVLLIGKSLIAHIINQLIIACMKNLFLLFMGVFYGSGIFAQQDNLSYIDPKIGNVGQLLVPTRPTVQLPNQMMRMYPLREDYLADQISGFPLLIVSHRLGEAFSVKPLTGPLNEESRAKKLCYDHDLEITRPWYYSVYFTDNEASVEYVPGKKTGIFRFTFPKNADKKILLFNTLNGGEGNFDFVSPAEMTGTETFHNDIKIYLYGKFSAGGTATVSAGKRGESSVFFGQASPDVIEYRYAVSFISPEQARKNYEHELNEVSFGELQDKGKAAWAKVMQRIKIQGGTDAQKRSFFSALYRCYERMVDISEDGRYYSGFDKKIHTSSRPFYVDDWTWDTYLAHHPLRAILDPAMEEDILNSYVQMYEQSGWMPTFPVIFGDHACMNGFHSSIMFLDDYRKGLRNFDIEKAYQGMYKNGMEATMIPWKNGPKTSLDDIYQVKGYFPALKPGEKEWNTVVHPFEKRQAVAVTLGGSYDDWAVGQMAAELHKERDAAIFNRRHLNYKNLWNEQLQMFMPKDSAGAWINIDPKFDGGNGGRDYFDENNGWTYLWQVQQDIPGLINLFGGKLPFENKLDQLFREPLGRSKSDMWYKFPDATGLVGQYSMGNEPSFHIPYLYNFTNSPWKTQKRVRFLLDVWFKDNIFGIPGDEDGGGMSAFAVFSSLGFYPVTPGLPVYTIGSPVFEKSTIDLSNGKQFVLIADSCSVVNKYIQHATLNGKELNTPWFSHQELQAGGILHLIMGPKPNKQWGIDPRPTSLPN